MTRRAMTLLETVLALGLLGALAVAAATLVGIVARGLAPATAQREWELAAEATMRRLHDDFAIGDEGGVKAWTRDGSLVVRTRAPAPGGSGVGETVEYRLDPVLGSLSRCATGSGGPGVPLIGELVEFIARSSEDGAWMVTLRSKRGETVTRRIAEP